MTDAPEKIYLQWNPDDDPISDLPDGEGITWSEDRVYESDVEYVRRDRLVAENRRLRAKCKNLEKALKQINAMSKFTSQHCGSCRFVETISMCGILDCAESEEV